MIIKKYIMKIVILNNEKEYLLKMEKNKQIIPIFYACDLNYLPFLSVSLSSLKDNRNKDNYYHIYILCHDISKKSQEPILNLNEDNFKIEFVDVHDKLKVINNRLQLRDYYTSSTYYRLFIADMFKEYNKVIYLDSDTIVLDDISKLYNYNIKDNYVGAITDKVVNSNDTFKKYSKEVLGIKAKKYFNAGVIVMNLKMFRENNFYESFINLLSFYKFKVAQDQDYLNIICKDKIKYISNSWNVMPVRKEKRKKPSLIHYNLTMKPWHYIDIPYSLYFWKYAQKNYYIDEIRKAFGNHTIEKKLADDSTESNLIKLALQEINNPNNYLKLILNNPNNDCYENSDFISYEVSK